MKTILITGGTGGLGSAIADEARAAGHRIRILSRRPAPVSLPPNTEWAQADILTRDGLPEALEGVDTVIHAATSPLRRAWETEVEGTRHVAAAAKAARTPHFVYVSIVGIDRIPNPRHTPLITTDPQRVPYFYYRAKLAAEQVVMASGVNFTLQRVTQFHSLLDVFLGMLFRLPIALLPTDFRSQPIATHDAAAALIYLAENEARGRVADIGGPQVLTWGELAKGWLAARGLRRAWLPLYVPGRLATVFREGYTTCPDARTGIQPWEAWLRERYARRTDDARRPVREA